MRHRNMLHTSRGARRCRENPRPPSAPSPREPGALAGIATARHPGVRSRRRKPLHGLRGLGCAGSWCKPQVLPSDAGGAKPSVSALAADMLQRGWVTREEYTQLLLGDRLYTLHEAEQEPPQQRRGIVRKLSKNTRPKFVKGMRTRSKARKRKTTSGTTRVPKATEQKKNERPVHPCRDPITLDDLGSWTWDFRAAEAATPPVSCGGISSKSLSSDASGKKCRGKGLHGGGGSGGGDGGGSGGAGGVGKREGVSSSAVVTYNVESLVLYLLESGDFQEPTTRRPFSLVQLADLDRHAAKSGAKVKGSLVTSYLEGQAKYREQRERREMLVGADRCLGDVVSEMLSTIEDSDDPHEEAHIYLVTLFPQFTHIFSELKEADEEFARQCLDQYKGTLRGPPNHRTQEQGGLLRTALDFLREQGGNDVDREGGDAEHPPDAVESDGDSGGRGGSSSGGSSADEHDDDDESSDDGGGVRSD